MSWAIKSDSGGESDYGDSDGTQFLRPEAGDAKQHCMRFSAYDEALGLPMFVRVLALFRIDPKATRDEARLLNAFDPHRARIFR